MSDTKSKGKSASGASPQNVVLTNTQCDGGDPCTNCLARCQTCIFIPRGRQATLEQRIRALTGTLGEHGHGIPAGVNTADLVARLVDVERRLSLMSSQNEPRNGALPHKLYAYTLSSDEQQASPAKTDLQAVLEPDGQTFAGEISMSPGLQDDGPSHGGRDGRRSSSSAAAAPEYPSRSPLHNTDPTAVSGDRDGTRKVRAWLEPVLEQHGVVADEAEWRRYMHFFLDEIHVLYPFLHPPSLWETFNELWEYSALWPMASPAEREHKRMSVALVCFALALGRCTVSSRVTDADGVHSSGWTLYSVGTSLLQDAEESNTAARSLLGLQTLLMRVIYLFRLDAPQRGARMLALAVCNAHIIGLNRQRTLDAMPVFPSQMFARAWWCIYVIDRRIGLDCGRPYLIQDANVDTALPLNLGDDWLTRMIPRPERPAQLRAEMDREADAGRETPIPYLQAMVRYSRVAGKVWELLYGVKTVPLGSSSAMVEYTDTVLCELLDDLPGSLSYDPDVPWDVQFSTRPRWQVKQAMLLFIVSINRTFRLFSTNCLPSAQTLFSCSSASPSPRTLHPAHRQRLTTWSPQPRARAWPPASWPRTTGSAITA